MTNQQHAAFHITGLDESAVILNHTPFDWNIRGEIDSPKHYSDFVNISYLFPYQFEPEECAVVLQEGLSLCSAIRVTRDLQRFNGFGGIWAVVRSKGGGQRIKRNPFDTKPRPKDGVELELKELVEVK